MKECDLPAGWANAFKALQPGQMEMITLNDGSEFVIIRREDLERVAGVGLKKDWLKMLGIKK